MFRRRLRQMISTNKDQGKFLLKQKVYQAQNDIQ